MIAGTVNAMSAALRGVVSLEGDPTLLVQFQRALPGSPTRGDGEQGGREGTANVSADIVKILDGNTFVVSDPRGDIDASLTDPTGLFSFDTRFLSTWVLTVDGERLNALSVDDLQYFEARFFLVPGTGTVYVDAKLSVIRQRAVGNGFHEELTILNHDAEPIDLTVRIDADSDFADLFEVKDALTKKGTYYHPDREDGLLLVYERETFVRMTRISASAPPAIDEQGFDLRLPSNPTARGRPTSTWYRRRCRRTIRPPQVSPRRPPGAAEHAAEPRELARRRTAAGMRRPPLTRDLPAQPCRPGRAPLLTVDRGWPEPARGRAALVHDDVRSRQSPDEPAGAAVHTRAGHHDPARARRDAGYADRRLSR